MTTAYTRFPSASTQGYTPVDTGFGLVAGQTLGLWILIAFVLLVLSVLAVGLADRAICRRSTDAPVLAIGISPKVLIGAEALQTACQIGLALAISVPIGMLASAGFAIARHASVLSALHGYAIVLPLALASLLVCTLVSILATGKRFDMSALRRG